MDARDAARSERVTPQVYGEYLLISRMIERSMAEVFLAVKLADRSGRLVVLKRAPIDEASSGAIAESLRREADVLRDGRIDGVVALLDEGEIAGLPFVVLEHVKGEPFDAVLASGALDRDAVMLLGRDVAKALAGLHARGWIHGDVTPSNIVVDEAGEATLVDLGIARKIGEAREMPAGKPGYAAPEAAMGKPASPSDDVYSWGTVVAEGLLGSRLFRERDLAEAAARRSELPLGVEDAPVVASALALDPAARPTASDLVAAIQPDHDKRRALANAVLSAGLRGGEEGRQRTSDDAVARTASDGGRMVQASSVRPGPPAPARRWLLPVGSLIVGAALVGGFFIGRNTAPRRIETSLTLPQLPPRAEVKLDGRTLLGAGATRKIPIEPGSHKLTIQLLKRDAREYEFVADPGDHVVLVVVPMNRNAGRNDKNDPDG